MSLIPQEHLGPEEEESAPAPRDSGPSFGDVAAPTGSFTQEDSGPAARGGGTDPNVQTVVGYPAEDSAPSHEWPSGRLDEIEGDV